MNEQLYAGDCLDVMDAMPDDSVDLAFFSPPYEAQRTYSIGFSLKGQAWVDFMVKVFVQCRRVCRGLVACVCQGFTKQFRWSATPALLVANLHRAGFNLRNPPIFHRVGIPGSGGPDWLRSDYEWIICTSRPGKLPWSDNTAMGHPPKWAPGGEMSYRLSDGSRRNQWGSNHSSESGPEGTSNGRPRKSHVMLTNGERSRMVGPNGEKVSASKGNRIDKRVADQGRESNELQKYKPPTKANPGNVIHCKVGGGLMGGDEFCSQNEAPFPEPMAEFFVRSFCPPGGMVLDPFCGSGTTLAVAKRYGRFGIGIDIRQSMIDLTRKRLESETPLMFVH